MDSKTPFSRKVKSVVFSATVLLVSASLFASVVSAARYFFWSQEEFKPFWVWMFLSFILMDLVLTWISASTEDLDKVDAVIQKMKKN
jgi:hypothetical protein